MGRAKERCQLKSSYGTARVFPLKHVDGTWMDLDVLAILVMNKKGWVIASGIAAVCCVLIVAPSPMAVFLSLASGWAGLWLVIRSSIRWWKQLPFLQRAESVAEISSVEYFRRVPILPLENWVRKALSSHGFLLLGDPVLGRSPVQGYAWMNGKKAVVVMRLERILVAQDLESIYRLKNKVKAELAIIFSPFSSAPSSTYPGLEVLAGKSFIKWMKVLSDVKPINIGEPVHLTCSCGSPQLEHVSRAGEPVLICSRYPDCREPRVSAILSAAA